MHLDDARTSPLLSLTWTAANAPARPTAPRAAARAVLLPQSTPVAPAARPSLGAITSPATSTHFDRFVRLFRGHFDNLEQVEVERAAGVEPRLGGGHEHIHCRLQPLGSSAATAAELVLATYYFDGEPNRVFRERLYALRPVAREPDFGACIEMRIFRLRAEVEEALAADGARRDARAAVRWGAADVAEGQAIGGADVYWKWCGERFEGRMRTESVVIDSPVLGKPLVVRDDVALWEAEGGGADALWVNDRGTDLEGNYVYGNIHDLPYKMRRVADSHWTSSGRPCSGFSLDACDAE